MQHVLEVLSLNETLDVRVFSLTIGCLDVALLWPYAGHAGKVRHQAPHLLRQDLPLQPRVAALRPESSFLAAELGHVWDVLRRPRLHERPRMEVGEHDPGTAFFEAAPSLRHRASVHHWNDGNLSADEDPVLGDFRRHRRGVEALDVCGGSPVLLFSRLDCPISDEFVRTEIVQVRIPGAIAVEKADLLEEHSVAAFTFLASSPQQAFLQRSRLQGGSLLHERKESLAREGGERRHDRDLCRRRFVGGESVVELHGLVRRPKHASTEAVRTNPLSVSSRTVSHGLAPAGLGQGEMPFGPLLSLRHPHGLPLVTVVAVVPDLCRLTGLYSADEVLEGLLIGTVAVAVHIVTLSSNRQT